MTVSPTTVREMLELALFDQWHLEPSEYPETDFDKLANVVEGFYAAKIRQAVEAAEAFRQYEATFGGYTRLHIFVEDSNVHDSDLTFCRDLAANEGDQPGVDLCNQFLALDYETRCDIWRAHNGYHPDDWDDGQPDSSPGDGDGEPMGYPRDHLVFLDKEDPEDNG